MKAIVIHRFGPPEVLSHETIPDPAPRAGEIRIRVHAATVNRVLDVRVRAGTEAHYGAVLPLIPGVDCAGVVDAVGQGVTRWRNGDRVAAAGNMPLDVCAEDAAGYTGPIGMMGIRRPGGFAELVCVPASTGVAVPTALDFHHAAVIMRHAPTAWNLLCNVARLEASETVLIMGAGGNLGSIGIQIAKKVIGATVIAAAGSPANVQVGRDLGADYGIDYRTRDIHDAVMEITGGRGVNVLYDNIASSPSSAGRATAPKTTPPASWPPPRARSKRRSSACCRSRARSMRIE
jgi:NADPH:quinone reductase-like Zn-dependent oxidoreductase